MNRLRPALDKIESGYRMEADGTTAEVVVYGVIGGWYDGVDAASFMRELAALDVDTILLRVNSPGGIVYEGVAMMNAIARHSAKVIATVDGLAASAASFLIMAADEIVMGRGAELMIHDAWNIAMGSAGDLRKEADSLDRLSDTVASLYAERAGGTTQEWRDAMLAETWYSDDEAVAAGLADRVEPLTATSSTEASASVVSLARAAGFSHTGRADAPEPYIPFPAASARPTKTSAIAALAALTGAVNEPPASPAGTHPSTGEEVAPMSDLKKKLGERLGVAAAADKTDDEILAAVDEALNEQADEPQAQVLPEGVVTIDADALAALQSDAAAGRAARTQQETDARAALVDAAVNDGRIAPARRDHWAAALAADPGAADVLAGLSTGLVPLEAKGFTGGVDESPDEDSGIYAKAWGTSEKKGA